MKPILASATALIVVICLGFGLNALGMISYSFFGKWQEQIRTDIQRESFAYTDGMQKNLQQMANDWAVADADGKAMILSGVRAQYASIDTTEYPAHLRDFLRTAGIY